MCFDSFSDFGSYHKYDSFKHLNFDKDIFKKHKINKKARNFLLKKKLKSIFLKNSSGNFLGPTY
jgi:hypothetical protein